MRKLKTELKAEEEGRLDQYLASKLEISRSRLQKLIRSGKILVNGKKVKPSHSLRIGEIISVEMEIEDQGPEPMDVQFKIIHEDFQIIIIEKPPGLTVHPAPGVKEPTLVNGLLKIRPEIKGVGSVERPGIVHRLDKDTSGIMIIAKTPEAYWNLQKQFQERVIKKSYLAIVEGKTPSRGEIPFSIGRDPHHPGKFAVGAYATKEAFTEYIKIREKENYSLLLVCPRTGRTHQIRVHLSFAGHPIAGDPLYGNAPGPIGRLALHALCISFLHPESGQRVKFCTSPPQEFTQFIPLPKKYPNFCSSEP